MAEINYIRCNPNECGSCEDLGGSRVNCSHGITIGIDVVTERYTLNDPCHYERTSDNKLSDGPALLSIDGTRRNGQ